MSIFYSIHFKVEVVRSDTALKLDRDGGFGIKATEDIKQNDIIEGLIGLLINYYADVQVISVWISSVCYLL